MKMFGSLATGLAELSSDMDLGVIGVYHPTQAGMKKLKRILQDETAFEKIMMIDTASVPIIKLEVNLKSLRKSHGLDEAMEERSPPTELVPEKANTYKVDIAFNEIEGTG